MQPKYVINDTTYTVDPRTIGNRHHLLIDGALVELAFEWLGQGRVRLEVDGTFQEAWVVQDEDVLHVHIGGRSWIVKSNDGLRDGADGGSAGDGEVRAPMPGVVVDVMVTAGQVISAQETLMLIESMKMQTEIKALVSGTIAEVLLSAGENFDRGQLLVTVATEGADT